MIPQSPLAAERGEADFAAADAETSAILALASRGVDLGTRAPLTFREAVCISRAYKALREVPTPESGAHREVRKSVVCEKCYGLTSCWCPPTPDRAAVREGLINAIEALRVTVHRAPSEEFAMLWRNVHRAIDALLAAVSRPAEARGEPWGYACRVRYTDNVASDWWIRFRTEELPTSHQAQVIPLYTRPLPDDVHAAVDALNAKKYPPPLAYDQSIFNGAINEAVDTLLAHLQRTEGA